MRMGEFLNREQAAKWWPLLKAFAEGATIERLDSAVMLTAAMNPARRWRVHSDGTEIELINSRWDESRVQDSSLSAAMRDQQRQSGTNPQPCDARGQTAAASVQN